MSRCALWCGLTGIFAVAAGSHAAVASLDDIEFWVGAGANRAGVAIDWDGDNAADSSLAWGFRWDGAASGADMIRAAIDADPRLFAKLDPSGALGLAIYGVGYDLNGDSAFAIDDGTAFNAEGTAISGPADLAVSVDPGDLYREGWFTGVWNYSTANANPWPTAGWTYSVIGASSRALVDGAWDSWAFTSTFRTAAFAANALAAPSTLSADFDSDLDVDGGDFLIWQRGLGSGAEHELGDANGDGVVDAIDLAAWNVQFGTSASVAAAGAVPEPIALITCISASLGLFFLTGTRRRRRQP
jgi:hypothetical protein